MKQILLVALCVLAVLTSCKPPKPESDPTGIPFTIKRADISGAKFLTLASSENGQSLSKATTGTSHLCKIDENGNMTTVVFYIEVDSDGNKTTVNATGDIKVTPNKIIDYGKEYMLFYDCTIDFLTDKYPHSYDTRGIYLLVRKSDGAIFEVGDDQILCFPNPYYETDVASMKIAYNDRGELYMIGNNNNVSKLKLENGKLLLQQLTTGIHAGGILLDKNDNLFVTSGYPQYNTSIGGGIMYFANGGVTLSDNNYVILLIDREYYCIERSYSGQYPDRVYTTKLHKMNLDAPNLSLQEIATTTSSEELSLSDIAIDNESRVLFISNFNEFNPNETYMVFDKSTKQLSVIPLSDGFDKVQYNAQGVAYEYSTEYCGQITRYNIVDMTKKTIDCDRRVAPTFFQKGTKETLTDFFEFGIKDLKGAPICVQTNLETGKVTVIKDADNRTITELIRVS